MEKIIKKAIEGGWRESGYDKQVSATIVIFRSNILDPLFWQALGKACGWRNKRTYNQADQLEVESYWTIYALRFHEINLTEGFSKAVEWLEELIKE